MALGLKGVSVFRLFGLLFLVGGLFTSPLLQAGSVEEVEVRHHRGEYHLQVLASIAVPPAELMTLLTDYERVGKANAAIKSVTVLPAPTEGVTRLAATLEVCVWFYCRLLRQTQDMRLPAENHLTATIIPEFSDYKSGSASWMLAPERQGSALTFAVAIEPDFWVPPLIGPLLIKRKMREEAIETVTGIELLAVGRH